MANVKQIKIRGIVPFNYYEDPVVAKMFAYIVSPSSGLKITWKSAGYQPSKHGGQTHMYEFIVTGKESPCEWIDDSIIKGVDALGYRILEDHMTVLEE